MDPRDVVSPPHVAKPLRLEPFTGLMLSSRRVGDPASARVFARPYRAVGDRLLQWEARGHVVRDEGPALYLHEFTAGGLTVRGLVGGLALADLATGLDDRAIWPHEGIHPGQVEELAARMWEMEINPAPILLVHRGPAAVREVLDEVGGTTPLREFTDRAGQRQRLWAIRDPDTLTALAAGLHGSEALLADGHHRYAAYLTNQQAAPGSPWDRGLAMLVDQDDTPLFLGAIHRVLRGASLDDLLVVVRAGRGRIRELPHDAAVAALATRTMVLTDGHRWAVVTVPSDTLPVDHLHQELIPALSTQVDVHHHHAVDTTLEHTRDGDVAVLMPALGFDEVHDLLDRGRLLPEKATSFQPKPSLGVLMRSLRDG